MQIRYTATPSDTRALMRYNLGHSPRFWFMLLGLTIFAASVNALVVFATRHALMLEDLKSGVIVGVVLAAAIPIIVPLRTKRDERLLNIDPEGIQTTIGRLSGTVPWSRVASVDVTPEYIFITGTSGNGFTIPARAFASLQDRQAFLTQVETFRGRSTTP